MSRRDKGKKGGRGGMAPFKPIYNYVWKSPAWAALKPTERCVYLEIKFRYQGDNNGKIAVSVREIAKVLGVGRSTVSRALIRLSEIGFIVAETASGFNRKDRHSTEYRLTEEPSDMPGASRIPTKDFMKWTPENSNNSPTSRHHSPTSEHRAPKKRPKTASQSHHKPCAPPKTPVHSPTTSPLIVSTIGGASGKRSRLVKSIVEVSPAKGIESDANQKAIAINAEPFSQSSDCGTDLEAIVQKPIFSLIKKMEVVDCDS